MRKIREKNDTRSDVPYNVINDEKILAFQQQKVAVEEFHAGPLPHPDILKGYDEIISNGAERIFCQFEKQTNHRIFMEKFGMIIGASAQIIGAFLITLVLIILAYLLAIKGIVGVAIAMITSAAGIVLAFYGLNYRVNKIAKKDDE